MTQSEWCNDSLLYAMWINFSLQSYFWVQLRTSGESNYPKESPRWETRPKTLWVSERTKRMNQDESGRTGRWRQQHGVVLGVDSNYMLNLLLNLPSTNHVNKETKKLIWGKKLIQIVPQWILYFERQTHFGSLVKCDFGDMISFSPPLVESYFCISLSCHLAISSTL